MASLRGTAHSARHWRVASGAAVTMALLVTAACAPAQTARPGVPGAQVTGTVTSPPSVPATKAPSPKPRRPVRVHVWMQPRASLHKRTLRAAAITNLVSGAMVRWEVGTVPRRGQWVALSSGRAMVRHRRLAFRTVLHSVPARKLYVDLTFTTWDQPDVVLARYGEFGWNMISDHAQGHGTYRTLEYTVAASRG